MKSDTSAFRDSPIIWNEDGDHFQKKSR